MSIWTLRPWHCACTQHTGTSPGEASPPGPARTPSAACLKVSPLASLRLGLLTLSPPGLCDPRQGHQPPWVPACKARRQSAFQAGILRKANFEAPLSPSSAALAIYYYNGLGQ